MSLLQVHEPESEAEIVEIVKNAERLVIGDSWGYGILSPFRAHLAWIDRKQRIDSLRENYSPEFVNKHWSLENLEVGIEPECFEYQQLHLGRVNGVIDFSRANQTIRVKAGTGIARIQATLVEQGYCIPIPYRGSWVTDRSDEDYSRVVDNCNEALHQNVEWILANHSPVGIGETISLDAPHAFQSACGSWRDWVIGCKMVSADGTIVNSGSGVVKSVSGFDLHKLLIGARHTLGIISEVTLRVVPLGLVTQPVFTEGPLFPVTDRFWKTRVICHSVSTLQDFDDAIREYGDSLFCGVRESKMLWAFPEDPNFQPKRYFGDRVWRKSPRPEELEIYPQIQALMRRTKQLFDPTNKLNPGEFGFI